VTSAPRVREQDREWVEFQKLNEMRNHWQRLGWHDGRQAYYWFLTFEHAGELLRLAAATQQHLQVPFLDLVPPDGLHLTIQRVGFADDVSEDRAMAVADMLKPLLIHVDPFSVELGRLAGSAGAIRLPATPVAPIRRLRKVARQAVAQELGVRLQDDRFWPHVGLAYCNSQVPIERILPLVAALREAAPVPAQVKEIHLVRLERQRRSYRWKTILTLPLGGAPARANRLESHLE